MLIRLHLNWLLMASSSILITFAIKKKWIVKINSTNLREDHNPYDSTAERNEMIEQMGMYISVGESFSQPTSIFKQWLSLFSLRCSTLVLSASIVLDNIGLHLL